MIIIFQTLLVSTATAERSFSSMKVVNSCLRSNQSQNRFESLCFLYIEKDYMMDKIKTKEIKNKILEKLLE